MRPSPPAPTTQKRALEIWANEECTIRPESLTIPSRGTVYAQINRDIGLNQEVRFVGTVEDEGRPSSFVQCTVNVSQIYSCISLNDDSILAEGTSVIDSGQVYRLVNNTGHTITLLSFSLGPVITDNPTIVPSSICSVPMYYDQTEQVWLYAIACLNSNGEYVFLEATNNSSKVHVTSQMYDGNPVFAFTPSPLPAIAYPTADVPFTFSAAYARQYGKHAPYTHRLDNIQVVEPGRYSYAIALLVDGTSIVSQAALITDDESPMMIPVHNEIY